MEYAEIEEDSLSNVFSRDGYTSKSSELASSPRHHQQQSTTCGDAVITIDDDDDEDEEQDVNFDDFNPNEHHLDGINTALTAKDDLHLDYLQDDPKHAVYLDQTFQNDFLELREKLLSYRNSQELSESLSSGSLKEDLNLKYPRGKFTGNPKGKKMCEEVIARFYAEAVRLMFRLFLDERSNQQYLRLPTCQEFKKKYSEIEHPEHLQELTEGSTDLIKIKKFERAIRLAKAKLNLREKGNRGCLFRIGTLLENPKTYYATGGRPGKLVMVRSAIIDKLLDKRRTSRDAKKFSIPYAKPVGVSAVRFNPIEEKPIVGLDDLLYAVSKDTTPFDGVYDEHLDRKVKDDKFNY